MRNGAVKRRWLKWLLRSIWISATVGVVAISLRVGYSFTDWGRSARLLNALQGGQDDVFDASLTKLGLLPTLPEGWQRHLVMFDMLKSIRPLTPDDYACLLDNERLRYTAIKGLEAAGDPRAIRPLLVDSRAGKVWDNQLPDVWARCGDAPFLALLSDSDATIRADVVDFLTVMHPEGAGNPLDSALPPLLNDPDPDVRIAAAESLASRGNKAALSVLIAEFRRLAQDESQEDVWLTQARRGQIAAAEFVARRDRFARLFWALRAMDDPAASQTLRIHSQRQAETAKRQHAEALAATFGPEDGNWLLYVFLAPQSPHSGHCRPSITPERELAIGPPPYIVPVQNKSSSENLRSEFGAPAHESPSVWEITDLEGNKSKITGIAWSYGDQLEVLMVDGRAEYIKTTTPDRRAVFGG